MRYLEGNSFCLYYFLVWCSACLEDGLGLGIEMKSLYENMLER